MAPKTTKWNLDPHTEAKHELVRLYLEAWLPVMSMRKSPPRRLVLLDGFAGPGVYSRGERGSPLVALQTLLEHASFERMSQIRFNFVFCEIEPERFASLDEQVAAYKRMHRAWPSNVHTYVKNLSFVDGGIWLAEQMDRIGKPRVQPPLFAFIDPFGVKGLPIDLIRRLMQPDGAEVLVNYMRNTVQRFAGAGNLDQHLRDLFGNEDFADIDDHPDRQARLRAMYPDRLREVCGFEHTLSFEMVNLSGQSYDLVYGTRSLMGIEKMKDAMWKIDPNGGFKFEDRRVGTLSFLASDAMRIPMVKAELLRGLVNQGPVSDEDIRRFILLETPYRAAHWKAPLAELEKEGRVRLVSTPSTNRRLGTYPKGTVVELV